MKPLRIIHCANFNTIRLKGCYMASMGYKLTNGLVRLGHQVLLYSDRDMTRTFGIWGKKCPGAITKNNKNFIKFCLNLRPDVIFLGHADTISLKTLFSIKEAIPNVKIVQWNVDSINPSLPEGQHNIENIKQKLPAVDLTLITTAKKDLLKIFEPSKHKVYFIPNPVDRSIETAQVFSNPDTKYDLFFAASPKVKRDVGGTLMDGEELYNYISSNCPKAKLMFPRINHPSADGIAYLELLKNSAMVLNLSRTADDYLYSSDRMAHAMGNGCLIFQDLRTGFQNIFKEDEIAFYSTPEELVSKINFYLEHKDQRMSMAQKGWQHYYELFNETRVASYVLSLLDNTFNPKDYPFLS